MATVYDVAAYILQKQGNMTAIKLQKLIYYAQAWSLVWDDKPLFAERVRAWVNGPVVPELYAKYKGQYEVTGCVEGNPDELSLEQQESIDAVLKTYGDKTSQWLSDLTHREDPWLKARVGLAPGERGNREIPLDAMLEYYSTLSLSLAA